MTFHNAESLLKADCSQCAALCCMAFSFDRSEMFAIDKPAGEACRHLGADHGCAIHSSLRQKGFAGCVQYDCLGAGQRVTQEVFAGRSWRDEPNLVGPMMEAFRSMRAVHELLLLLKTARKLNLAQAQDQQAEEFERALSPLEGWSAQYLQDFDLSGYGSAIRKFLESLRDAVPQNLQKKLT